jgi:hypothetical protein
MNNNTFKPSTEKASLSQNKAQEKEAHYFKWPLTTSHHIPHKQKSSSSSCKTNTTKYMLQQIYNTQRTELCTISNSCNKVHKKGTKYQATNEKCHTQTNTMVTKA